LLWSFLYNPPEENTPMKTILFALLLSTVACGGDDEPTKYQGTITCTAVCDGETSSADIGQVCDTEERILDALQAGADECDRQAAMNCTTHSCECTIPSTLPTCD
jgi:hypothetical protein